MAQGNRVGKVFSFANMSLRWIRSYPHVSVAYLVVGPLFFFMIAVLISGTIDLRSLIVPLISVSVSNSILISREYWEDRKMGLHLHYMLCMNPFDYVVGYMLSKLILIFAGLLIIFGLASIFLGIGILGKVPYVMLPLTEIWLFCCTLGFIIGVKANDMRSASMAGELSWLLLLGTSTTFYDSIILPIPFRYLLLLNPLTFSTEALKSSFGFATLLGYWENSALMGGLTMLVLIYLLKSFRWRL
jgi:ABC-type multidrug transport system permease subunit